MLYFHLTCGVVLEPSFEYGIRGDECGVVMRDEQIGLVELDNARRGELVSIVDLGFE